MRKSKEFYDALRFLHTNIFDKNLKFKQLPGNVTT